MIYPTRNLILKITDIILYVNFCFSPPTKPTEPTEPDDSSGDHDPVLRLLVPSLRQETRKTDGPGPSFTYSNETVE